jgi:hypothetical protein
MEKMKKMKSMFKLLGLVFLIILASIGIGIVGGVPLFPTSKREDNVVVKIELVESKEEKTDLDQLSILNIKN